MLTNVQKRFGPPGSKDKLADRIRSVSERPSAAAAAPPRNPRRERAERKLLYRRGVLVFGDGVRLEIALKNLSAGGARVEYFTNVELPAEVVLIEPTLNLRRRAGVIWQRDGAAGLRFLD